MQTVDVVCPSCGERLTVSREHIGRKGRCQSCREVFIITDTSGVPLGQNQTDLGETIIGWLDESEQAAALKSKTAVAPRPAARPRQARQVNKNKPPDRRKQFPIKLGHVDEMGAFFLFSPDLLYDEDFRSAFSQRCVVCGNRRHLSVHLVVWSSKLPGRGEFGARTSYSRSVFELDKLGGLTGGDLLAKLDRIENLPEPYCLPFPYYLCPDCSPIGAIVPDVRLAADGQSQICELGIFAPKQAEEFVQAVGGPDCKALKALREEKRHDHDDPWRALPLAVRSRIKQWFNLEDGEKFVVYIPDGDFTKTEAGLAGIALTNKRMVFRKFASRVEIPLTERITIESVTAKGRSQLQISSRDTKPALLVANDVLAERLRMSLRRQGAKANWLAAQA